METLGECFIQRTRGEEFLRGRNLIENQIDLNYQGLIAAKNL